MDKNLFLLFFYAENSARKRFYTQKYEKISINMRKTY